MDCNRFNNRSNTMTEERADVPNHLLEHFLMTTQGVEESDAFFRVLQDYEEIRKQYYEHIKLN